MASALRVAAFLALFGACEAEAQACKHCQAEESSLLQAEVRAARAFPYMDALKDVVGNVADAADDIEDKVADGITKGLSTVTAAVDKALQNMDAKVDEFMEDCNKTFDTFKAAADINASLGDNITKFQELLNSTVEHAIPLCESINGQVDSLLSTMTWFLEKFGEGDMAETLNTSMMEAMSRMSSLSEYAKKSLADAAQVTEQLEKVTFLEAAMTLEKVNSVLGAASDSASKFADSLQSSLKEFTAGLKKVIQESLPEDKQQSAAEPVDSLLEKASASCEKLKRAVASLAAKVKESSGTVTESVTALSNKGFWGHLKDFFSSLR